MQLEEEFGRARLFMDVEGYIEAGADFSGLKRAGGGVRRVSRGDRAGWADLLGRAADGPGDFVRCRDHGRARSGKRVIPVLVGGASCPPRTICRKPSRVARNAVGLPHDRFKADARA